MQSNFTVKQRTDFRIDTFITHRIEHFVIINNLGKETELLIRKITTER